jgi:transposase InsO family protein
MKRFSPLTEIQLFAWIVQWSSSSAKCRESICRSWKIRATIMSSDVLGFAESIVEELACRVTGRTTRDCSSLAPPRLQVSEAVVSKYIVRRPGPPSQSWRTFLNNHVNELISLDFFTVPTATFRILFVFIVLSHNRRHIRHFNVTAHPTAMWKRRRLVEACGMATTPKFLIRDRGGIYGNRFQSEADALGIEEVITDAGAPWQNAYAERVIGSIHRECLDHMIIMGERHLKRILSCYVRYNHSARTHLSLDKDAPDSRVIQSSEQGTVVEFPCVGGLHHEYVRMAASRPESLSQVICAQ